jgi:hypothetical protein
MSPSMQTQMTVDAAEFLDIPGTQLMVSRVALGTWAMGGWMWGGTDRPNAIATIHAALHQGIGEALAGIRSEAEIATKEGIVNSAVPNPIGPEFMAPPQRCASPTLTETTT